MNKDTDSPAASSASRNSGADDDREYEQTGLYPPGQKPFRLLALMGFLLGVIAFIAVAAYALDRILL